MKLVLDHIAWDTGPRFEQLFIAFPSSTSIHNHYVCM